VPSSRVVVPSIDEVAPIVAVASPVVVTGGQSDAHSPEHVLFVPVSASNS